MLHAGQVETHAGSRRRFGWMLLGIGVVGLMARLAYIAVVAPHIKLGLDSIWYVLVGDTLSARHLYSDPALLFRGVNRPTADFPPLFPTFLAVLDRLGVKTTTGYQVAGAVCGGATIVLTGVLGRRISGRAGVGLAAAGLVAIGPALIAADASVMSETLAVPLSVAVLLAATWARASGSLRRWAVVGGLAGLVALARSEAVLVVVLLLPAIIVAGAPPRAGRRLAQCAVVLAAAGIVLLPWIVRNRVSFDPPVLFSSNADAVLAGANCRPAYHGSQIGLWEFGCIGFERRDKLGEARYAHVVRQEAIHFIVHNYTQVPPVMVVRAMRAWGLYNPAQQVRVEAVESRNVAWGRAAWLGSTFLLLLAIPGIVSMRHHRFELFLLAGPAVVASVVAAVTWGNQRFVLTAMPELAIAAALTLSRFVRPRREGRAQPQDG